MRKRVVLDANIYISALIKPTSPPGSVLKYLIEHEAYELVLTIDIVKELNRAIFYPKVRKYIKKSDKEITAWLDALAVHAFIPACLFSYGKIVEEDPDDDKYIIAALESSAKTIVSGDKHLLNLKNYQNVSILTAVEFLEN
jgi:putative PIN family toxin of toxin-antitoxin system